MNKHLRTARPFAKLREGRNDWYRIENNLQTSSAELWIYDEIGYFGVTAQDLVAELQGVNAQELTVHLNSPGGDVFDGIAIMNALRDHPATVTTQVDALAASICSVIMQAGDHRVMSPNSEIMIHEAAGLAIGNAADMRELAALLDRTSDNIASVYAERSGVGDVEQWRAAMGAETWYSADEAVAAGLADEVKGRTPTEPAEQPTASWDLSIFTFGGRSKAPDPAPVEPPVVAKAEPAFTFDPEFFRQAFREGIDA